MHSTPEEIKQRVEQIETLMSPLTNGSKRSLVSKRRILGTDQIAKKDMFRQFLDYLVETTPSTGLRSEQPTAQTKNKATTHKTISEVQEAHEDPNFLNDDLAEEDKLEDELNRRKKMNQSLRQMMDEEIND